MGKRAVLTLAMVALLSGVLSGCTTKLESEPEPTPTGVGPIRIGVVTSISGSLARFGQAHLQGYDIALQEINAAGGVLGRPLKLIFEDDGSVPQAAADAVEKLATEDQVPLIIGAYSSSATLLAAGMAERYQVPLIVPTAAADEITRQGYRWVFRISAPSQIYTQTLLDFMERIGRPARLAIVFENTSFGTSVAEAAERQARSRGIAVVAYHAYQACPEPCQPTSTTDFQPLLEQIKAVEPDAVLFVSYLDDAVALMKQSRAVDFSPPMFAAAGAGFSLPDFPQLARAAADYTISVTQWTPDAQWPGVSGFAERFKAKYNHAPQYHSAEAFAALYLAADVLRRAGEPSRPLARDALRSTDLATIFGDIRFDANGQNDHPMLVTQVIAGQFVTVYPEVGAARTAVFPVPPWSQRSAQRVAPGSVP